MEDLSFPIDPSPVPKQLPPVILLSTFELCRSRCWTVRTAIALHNRKPSSTSKAAQL